MKKRILSLALALALCLGLAVPAAAASVSNKAGVSLNAGERRIYNALEKVMLDIYAGKRLDTQMTVTLGDRELGWTARQLGLTRLDSNDPALPRAIQDKLNARLYQIYIALEYNHPYELFFDGGGDMRYEFRWQIAGSELWLTSLTASLIVSPDYRGSSDTTVDPGKRAKVVAGEALARQIVAENAGKSNYEKLAAYRDAICRLTSYDDARASLVDTDAYVFGHPSQAASVFDGDPNTLTICVGYARAFKYLCDLSDFDGDVRCFLASGNLDMGALGGGGHTWNVVRMEDGRYYLTDVTASNSGIYGKNHPLLACANEPAANYNNQTALYSYADYNYGLYTDGYLPLSATPYEPGHAVTTPEAPANPAATGFTDVKSGDFFAKPVQWAVENRITAGTSKTKFSPNQRCTVAQILSFLWRASGSPKPTIANPFSDVRSTDYFADAAIWAYEQGMVSGSAFRGTTPCTRSMAVTFLWKAAGSPSAAPSGFSDVPAGADYAGAVAWAVARGVTAGTSPTTFDPNANCNRGQIVSFLYRALAK